MFFPSFPSRILINPFAPLSVSVLAALLFCFFTTTFSVHSLEHRLLRRADQAIDTFSLHKTGDHDPSIEPLSHRSDCLIDQSQPPVMHDLISCRNASLFHTWRPMARFQAPRGWLNDPMAIFETSNGTYHVGYQCNLNLVVWGNASQCSASTKDFIHFEDYDSWKNPTTISPTQLYDIRGVFDGTVIKDGWNGYPTLIYTSASFGPLGARSNPAEHQGVETQSLAYTMDDGQSWIKLNFGQNGNPAIYQWPEQHLTGFRDPFVFNFPQLHKFYSNNTIDHQLPGLASPRQPTGSRFLTLSGGIRRDADPINGGPRMFLYRQTEENNVRDWTYLGVFLSLKAELNPSSPWRGSIGINFECGSIMQLNQHGRLIDPSPASDGLAELNIITVGTEGGRNGTHLDYWPVWHAVSFDYGSPDGNVKAKSEFSGVVDWGRAYAFCQFPFGKHRQLMVGWTFEDDEDRVLTSQRGYQGAMTLFRDVFVKVIRNIDPSALQSPEAGPSWTTRSEPDGTQSVVTFGQKIMPEILKAFRKESNTIKFDDRTLHAFNPYSLIGARGPSFTTNLTHFEVQPTGRYYAISAQLDFLESQNRYDSASANPSEVVRGGFRILASEHEWTDVYYDPVEEYLVVERLKSSAILSYGNSSEKAKHRLWPILDPNTNQTRLESLNLTIIVDNSVLEVHANEQTIITTRVYPWYSNSIGAHYLVQGYKPSNIVAQGHQVMSLNVTNLHIQPNSVRFSNVELWDGLLNAWPKRPRNTSLEGVYSNNISSTLYGLWSDS